MVEEPSAPPAVNVFVFAISILPAPNTLPISSVWSTSYTPLVPTLTKALLLSVPVTVIFPAFILVVPVLVFVPLKVKVPDPSLVKLPEPLIAPEKEVLPLLPADKVCELAISIVPAPEIELIVSEASTS